MIKTGLDTIKCPKCGAEYLPVELFIPNAFFGRPTEIEKDEHGQIVNIIGSTAQTTMDKYICDYCNTPFKVNTKVHFSAKILNDLNFEEDYSTNLKGQTMILKED